MLFKQWVVEGNNNERTGTSVENDFYFPMEQSFAIFRVKQG
jgi:hypothetical protein